VDNQKRNTGVIDDRTKLFYAMLFDLIIFFVMIASLIVFLAAGSETALNTAIVAALVGFNLRVFVIMPLKRRIACTCPLCMQRAQFAQCAPAEIGEDSRQIQKAIDRIRQWAKERGNPPDVWSNDANIPMLAEAMSAAGHLVEYWKNAVIEECKIRMFLDAQSQAPGK